ncbi:MAG: hypothetical protein ACYC6K_13220 [Bellilinea sp.]
MATKTRGVSIVGGFGLISLVLSLAGCGNIPGRYVAVFPITSPTVEVTPIPTKTLTQTIPPTPTETPTPAPTVEPSPTPEPAWEAELSNSVDPEVLDSVITRVRSMYEEANTDLTDATSSMAVSLGTVVSYEFHEDEGETSLFVLFATRDGIIKASVDFVDAINVSELPLQSMVGELKYKESLELSKVLDRTIDRLNADKDNEFYSADIPYLILKGTGSKNEERACLKYMAEMGTVDGACAFDPTKEIPDHTSMVVKVNSFTTSVKGVPPEDALNFERYATLSSEENVHVVLQIYEQRNIP